MFCYTFILYSSLYVFLYFCYIFLFSYCLVLNLCYKRFYFHFICKIVVVQISFIKKIFFKNSNCSCYVKVFIVWFSRHLPGKIWSPICMQDNVKLMLHYRIHPAHCGLLHNQINLMKIITLFFGTHRRINNSAKHLWWSFLRIYLPKFFAKISFLDLWLGSESQ